MLSGIWNWIVTDPREIKAKQLLLTIFIRNKFIRQKKAIIKLQRFVRHINIKKNLEENLYLIISRVKIKNNSRCYLV